MSRRTFHTCLCYDVLLEAMTYFLRPWRTSWYHAVFCLCHDMLFDVMKYFLTFMTYSLPPWCIVWRHDLLLEVMPYVLTSWRTFWKHYAFCMLWCTFWHHSVLFDVIRFKIGTYFPIFLTSWRTFWPPGVIFIIDVMMYFLHYDILSRNGILIDIMTYSLTALCTFQVHDIDTFLFYFMT